MTWNGLDIFGSSIPVHMAVKVAKIGLNMRIEGKRGADEKESEKDH